MRQASIGTCRLSIVDPESGSQPVIVTCRGTKTLVALNGEIYNFRELRRQLERDHHFCSESDTEVLAHLFEEEGIHCLRRLNGMFGICISDGARTYLIRDRFGVKPLYYRFDGDTLLFASEARSLVTPPVRLSIEPTYACFETTLGDETPFAGVREVPPAHYVVFDGRTGTMASHLYYSLDDTPIEHMDEDEAVDAFRALVEDAVRIRTDTELPYGCYVSGGLDSSVIASFARPSALLAAAVTDRPYMDERPHIHALCRHLNTEAIVVKPDPNTFAAVLVELVETLDFPVTTLAAFTQYLLSEAAAAQGLRIVLGGLGIDEYLSGYTRHAAMVFRKDRRALEAQFPEYRPLFAKLEDAGSESAAYYGLLNRASRRGDHALAAVKRHFESQRSTLNGMASTDMAISLPPLLRADDRINMRFGLESRSPFLDYRVVEFAYRLPDSLKIRRSAGGAILTKYILRRSTRDLVPAQIAARTDKVGFPSAVALWLAGPLRPIVERAREVVRGVPELAAFLDRADDTSEFSRTDWQLVQWAAWCLLFIHGLSAAEASLMLVSGPKTS